MTPLAQASSYCLLMATTKKKSPQPLLEDESSKQPCLKTKKALILGGRVPYHFSLLLKGASWCHRHLFCYQRNKIFGYCNGHARIWLMG